MSRYRPTSLHNHRARIGKLRFCSHRAFKRASLSRVPFALAGLFSSVLETQKNRAQFVLSLQKHEGRYTSHISLLYLNEK